MGHPLAGPNNTSLAHYWDRGGIAHGAGRRRRRSIRRWPTTRCAAMVARGQRWTGLRGLGRKGLIAKAPPRWRVRVEGHHWRQAREVVEGANSKIVELRGCGAVLVAAIPASKAAGRRRGARIGGWQWRALASACGGRRLEYGNALVDEAGTRGWLPGGGTTARRGGLPVTLRRHKE
jgi:hypothetical protein